MSIIRVDTSEGRWTPVPNQLASDPNLSLDTRGLVVFLLSKPPGWEVLAGALPGLLKDNNARGGHVGRHRVRKMLRQLETAGYLSRKCTRDAEGRWRWESVLRALPITVDRKSVDGDSGGGASVDRKAVDRDKTLSNQRPTNYKKNQPSNQSTAPSTFTPRLDFKPPFKGEHLESAVRLIEICEPLHRQTVLDEVAAIYELGKLRGNPCGLLRSLIQKASAGNFEPTYSKRRLVKKHKDSLPTRLQSNSHSNSPTNVGLIAEAMREAMQERIKNDAANTTSKAIDK